MNDFFVGLLFGHFVGDYLLQNNWMALSKNRTGLWGWFTCFVHCLVYTTSILVFTGIYNIQFAVLVFFSHYIIDKFSLAELWLKLIKGRSILQYLKEVKKIDAHMALRGGFTTLVYAVADNTMHLLVMYYVWMWVKQ